jgi:uncharacterized protein YjbI with pentapeptide repeats
MQSGGSAAPANAAEPTDDAALKEFLLKNFLYEGPADEVTTPIEPLRITIPDRLPAPAEQPRTLPKEPSSEAAATPIKVEAETTVVQISAPIESKAVVAARLTEGPANACLPAEVIATKSESKAEAAEEDEAAGATELPVSEEEREIAAEEEVIQAAAAAQRETDFAPKKPSDWAFEEKLAGHKEWVETQGVMGRRADLSCAQLEEAELIGVNLRYADLHAANLKAADMLLTDLRDACLMRANLQEACLVGANLEGANLEGATLDAAMGLVPRQLAGATLRDATLPPQIRQFSALREFERVSQLAKRYFTAILTISAISWLIIWKSKDAQLLTDSAIIPHLHSATADSAMPTDQIYLIAPVALFILYLVFQFHLQRLWDAVLELPAVFPGGQTLGEKSPRIITGLLRAHFRWMNQDAPSTRVIERLIAVLLAYWIAPFTLVLYWARYLTVQEFHGTLLHDFLATMAIGIAAYATAKVGRPQERWVLHGKGSGWLIAKFRQVSPISLAICACVLLTLLSVGTIKGVPHDRGRAPQFSMADIRRWAPTVFWSVGYNPYADLTEASISRRPANWTGADDQVASVSGAYLNNRHIRYAQAYGAFLANSHLWQTDFQGSFLSEADLRGADLGQANLRYVTLDRAQMNHANMDRAALDGANLTRVDMRDANLSYCSAVRAVLVDARLDGASLYAARLDAATMIRTSLEKADLRNAYLGDANLSHADLQQAYLWSAQLPGAHLEHARLGAAIFIEANLSHSDLQGAELPGTVLNGADLNGANLDGADLRGALGLTASQVCSATSRKGVLLDDPMAAQVDAQCGGVH